MADHALDGVIAFRGEAQFVDTFALEVISE